VDAPAIVTEDLQFSSVSRPVRTAVFEMPTSDGQHVVTSMHPPEPTEPSVSSDVGAYYHFV